MRRAIVIAGSTGSLSPLLRLTSQIASAGVCAPVFVILHLPAGFDEVVCTRLRDASGRMTHVSANDMIVRSDRIYLNANGIHCKIVRDGALVRLRHDDGPMNCFCKPSANILLQSAATAYGKDAIAIVLSGMGKDGLEGCAHLAAAGGLVLAQSMESSAVWGMPGAIVEAGLARATGDPDQLAGKICQAFAPARRNVA